MRYLLFIIIFTVSVKAADSNTQIFVDSRHGYAYVYIDGKLCQQQNILEKDYRDAVITNTLDSYWNIPEIKVNPDNTIPIPVKVAGFKHVNQIGGTCNEASYREWAVYFSGDLFSECLPLKDVGLFNTAVMKDTFRVSHENTLAKAKITKNGKVIYNGAIDKSKNRANKSQLVRWFKKYMNIDVLYHQHMAYFPTIAKIKPGDAMPRSYSTGSKKVKDEKYTHLFTQQLLLGNGIVAYCDIKGGGGHALNFFGTHGNQVYVSTWGNVYKGEFPEFGKFEFVNHASVLIPTRSVSGKVITGLEEHINDLGAAEVLVEDRSETVAPDESRPLVTYADLYKNPEKYKNKEVYLYASMDDLEIKGFRIFYRPLSKTGVSTGQERLLVKFKNNLINELPGKNEVFLHSKRYYILKGYFKYDPQAHSTFPLQTKFVNCVIMDLLQ